MRRANKLGLLGLAIALVAAFGIIGGLHGTSKVQAQAIGPKNCGEPNNGTTPSTFSPGATFVCTFVVTSLGSGAVTIAELTTGFSITGVSCAPPPTQTGSWVGDAVARAGVSSGVFQSVAGCGANPTLYETILVGSFGTSIGGVPLTQLVQCNTAGGCNGVTGPNTTFGAGDPGVVELIGNCGNSSNPVYYNGTCLGTTHQPTGEMKWCNNATTLQPLSQVIGGSTLDTSIQGPGTSFTIPLFGGASTCWIQLTQNGLSCTPNAVTGTTLVNTSAQICSDGYVTVSLTTPGSSAVLACGSTASPYALNTGGSPYQVISTTTGLPSYPYGQGPQGLYFSPNGGTCQSQTSGTSIILPCGVTAGTPQASTQSSWTCSSVVFDIASLLSGCATGQTNVGACPLGSNAYALTGGVATVTISFQTTPANGGVGGGIVLGTNTFTFQSPGVGTLLVTATPQLIPSNGTLASVITATFACGSGFSLTSSGFPLSATGVLASPGFTSPQSILGFGNTATCGAGLPGNFTFATPGEVLFDNGRTSESVGCGLNGQQNLFGGSSLFNPNNLNPTLPLVFTCTGAAVLAIGGGAAGDAPINVTYTSSVGGLTAVGSTLITVAPSGVPVISLSCNPSTIAAGNTGSLCTATVTDQNGTPLTGAEGATVTWTVSDPKEAEILPCVVNVSGTLTITSTPNIIPQITPSAPCNPASGSIPGQSVTFLNGQTTALLVASSYAQPEVVTVLASLGVLVPPEYACEVSPYRPVGYGAAQFPSSPAPSGFGPGLTGCGAGNPVGLTGLASALSTAGNVALNGIVTLPNATNASTMVSIGGLVNILVLGATPSSPLDLLHGCNNVIVTTTAGTPIANIAALVSPAAAVVGIWAFNNTARQFKAGYFRDPSAPVDFVITGVASGSTTTTSTVAAGTQVTESYFVCVDEASGISSG